MAQYCTVSDFSLAATGVQVKDLAAGALDAYIARASAAIEAYCNRVFAPQAGVVEVAYSSGAGRAKIAPNGHVLIYPVRGFPIRQVRSISWRVRGLALSGQTIEAPSSTSVNPADIAIEPDAYGDGALIHIFEDFSAYRDPRAVVEFTVTYDAGYTTYPDWLVEAAIEWTTHLLKKRGAQALVLAGSGVAVDQSSLGGHLEAAQAILEPHRRRF
jgi:hypothetical protein